MLKSYWVVVVAYRILVSAQGPLVLGFWVFELGVWGMGLTKLCAKPCKNCVQTLCLSFFPSQGNNSVDIESKSTVDKS